jgi:hypothetical protein
MSGAWWVVVVVFSIAYPGYGVPCVCCQLNCMQHVSAAAVVSRKGVQRALEEVFPLNLISCAAHMACRLSCRTRR